ncbi:hypothetical protein HY091_01170 [Candidatus Kaiserbacteria bacterium]|nr:hypothetical protein [Candidatus Kaiserbacteria bacterium]
MSNQLRPLLCQHWGVLLVALIAGCLTAFPQLINEHRMSAAYTGVHPIVSDDELYYLARAHETLDGHPTLGNPYLAEDKNQPGVQFWMPDAFFASVDQALFGNVRTGALVWDFLLPFGIVLGAYAVFYLLTADVLLALAGTIFLEPGRFFLEYNRTPNPQLFFVLLLSLLALLLYFRTKRTRYALFAALAGGSLFYIYPFYWTYWVVLVGLGIMLTFLFLRESGAWQKLGLIFLGACAIGVPYFISAYRAAHLPYYHESLVRIGVIETHFPSGIAAVSVAGATLLLVLWCWWKRFVPRTPETALIAAATLAGGIVMNQHLITGMNFQFIIHYTMPSVVMSVFALAACAAGLLTRSRESYRVPLRVLVLCIFVLYALIHTTPFVRAIATPSARDLAAERYGPVLAWLDAHTVTDAVVYADDALAPYIPAYTRDNVYFSPWAYLSYLPQAEVNTRFLGAHYFERPFTRESVTSRELDVFGAYYVGRSQHAATANKARRLLGLPVILEPRYPEEEVNALVAREAMLQRGSWQNALAGYRVDYLAWDTVADPGWNIGAVPGLTKVYAANGILVYAVAARKP